MTGVWALAALWLGLALIASLVSIWLRVSTALSEIVVGTIAQLIIGAMIGQGVRGTDESWVKFLSGIGAITPNASPTVRSNCCAVAWRRCPPRLKREPSSSAWRSNTSGWPTGWNANGLRMNRNRNEPTFVRLPHPGGEKRRVQQVQRHRQGACDVSTLGGDHRR
jgi:hypothetical protein